MRFLVSLVLYAVRRFDSVSVPPNCDAYHLDMLLPPEVSDAQQQYRCLADIPR